LRDPETIRPCTSRFWAGFRKSKPSPSGLEFAKSPGCKGGDGSIRVAEVHWYEAAGIGRREFKIKHLL